MASTESCTMIARPADLRIQTTAGAALTAVGLATLGGEISALTDYAYAIIWWGVLLLLDGWNLRRRGLSLWHGDTARFLTITLPASVLVWLLFEALNFPAPQWRYRGNIPGMWPKVLFGFVAFSTVIPIMVEFWWLVSGRQCVPAEFLAVVRRRRILCLVLAAVFAVVPFVNDIFWFNQGIWLIPALVLLPLVHAETCSLKSFARALAASGILAGLAWECFNYPARTHWEYLILPDVPHLFYMPVPGYLGFIPFGLSMLAVYEFQLSLKPSVLRGTVLYGVALAGLYWLTALYIEHGLWLS